MLTHSASLAMSTSILKAFPGKLDIKRHPDTLYSLYLQEPATHEINITSHQLSIGTRGQLLKKLSLIFSFLSLVPTMCEQAEKVLT